jgi:hypothetical protein
MTQRKCPLYLASIALILGFGTIATADKITLKSGRVIQGTIIEESDGFVVVKTDKGITARFDAQLVKSVEKALTPTAIYKKRLASAESAADHLFLARFATKHNMAKKARLHYEKVLELSPNQGEARDKLGFSWDGQKWISRADYMKTLGLVKYKSRWVSESEKDLLQARAEAKKNRGKVRRLVWEAVKHKKLDRQIKAREQLGAMTPEALARPFRSALVLASRAERAFVVDSISSHSETRVFNKMLSRSVIAEPVRKIRHAALAALSSKKDRHAATYFTSALSSESPILRINAAHALMQFPDRRAVGPLIMTLRFETGDFGRAHIVNFTQRAYIRDFELSSGGTGLAIAEVADPVIDTFTEGTVLDVKVRKVEWYSKAAVLTHLTGQNFGVNQNSWVKWWKNNKKGFKLAPNARKKREEYLSK